MVSIKEIVKAISIALITFLVLYLFDKIVNFDDNQQLNSREEQLSKDIVAKRMSRPLTSTLSRTDHRKKPATTISPMKSESVGSNSNSNVRPIATKSSSTIKTVSATVVPSKAATDAIKTMTIVPKHNLSTNSLSLFQDMTSSSCPNELVQAYRTVEESSATTADKNWCFHVKAAKHVVIGRSWGAMSAGDRKKWETIHCNEYITAGGLLSCSSRWGWDFFDSWTKSYKSAAHGVSKVESIANYKTATLYKLGNVAIKFSKLRAIGGSRLFGKGFLTSYGIVSDYSVYPKVPGIHHEDVHQDSLSAKQREEKLKELSKCEEWESRPVFVLSNDDIYNLAHNINDVVNIWTAFVLAGKNSRDAVLLNIDGVRKGGPAGGGSHRVMNPTNPDEYGPFVSYYESWFNEIKRGVDYKDKTVCFKEIYYPIQPGVPWYWHVWGSIDSCAKQGPSPLYQSFNLFLRQRWQEKFGDPLPNPPEDHIHVVVEVRSLMRKKSHIGTSLARTIKNLDDVIKAISSIPSVKVTAQDFAKIPFNEQVALAHSASILVSMHGAGTTHVFHQAIGRPNCCSLVELTPDSSVHTGNLENIAGMLGVYYQRLQAPSGSTSSDGTYVKTMHVKEAIVNAIAQMKKRTCLNDVKDSRKALFTGAFRNESAL